MDAELVEVKIDLAKILERLDHVQNTLAAQDKQLATQAAQISDLRSLADQGRGSLWLLLAGGGMLGAILSHIPTIKKFLTP
jgi:hypothetical protein